MRASLLFRKIHKWLGLLIGLQIILWFASGLVMSWFDIDRVRGAHVLKAADPVNMSGMGEALALFEQRHSRGVQSVEVVSLLSQTMLLINSDEEQLLFDPLSQSIISPLSAAQVRAEVTRLLAMPAEVVGVVLLDDLPGEVRGRPAPLWQVQLDDKDNTRVYVSPSSGQVLATRSDTWRLFDFFWMLHIMDYDERSDFNHPLLIGAAFLALLVALSGVWLLVQVFKPRKQRSV